MDVKEPRDFVFTRADVFEMHPRCVRTRLAAK
jgi:hypothetical protein